MEPKYIKVSQYAKIYNLNYKTALRQFHAGRIEGYQIVIFPPVQACEIYGIWDFSYNVASDYCSILLPKFFGKYKQ